MRGLVIIALSALALCACATDQNVRQQAALNCQAVGINEKDPQFETCTRAITQQYRENRIAQTYRDTHRGPITDVERRTPHVDAN